MFNGEGSFGSRMIQVAAAGRYTKVRLNNDFLKYFTDFEITDKNTDPENPEPKCYLPTIPWVLVNGAEGIAVGFATYILPRAPEDLKNYIRSRLLNKKSLYNFEPYFKGFQGKIHKDPNSNSWIMEGCFEKIKNGLVKITELPIGFDREKYVTYLEKLLERKEIKDYDEDCKKNFGFTVKVEKDLTDEEIINLLRLRTTLTENIVVIDNENKLRQFDNPEKICDYFIEYRLAKYNERIRRNTQITSDDIDLIKEKKKFVSMIINNKIDLTKLTRQELVKLLKINDFVFTEKLIDMKIYQFTIDEIEKLLEQEKELYKQLEALHATSGIAEWVKELK
jgi:DNA topoisomerase-2